MIRTLTLSHQRGLDRNQHMLPCSRRHMTSPVEVCKSPQRHAPLARRPALNVEHLHRAQAPLLLQLKSNGRVGGSHNQLSNSPLLVAFRSSARRSSSSSPLPPSPFRLSHFLILPAATPTGVSASAYFVAFMLVTVYRSHRSTYDAIIHQIRFLVHSLHSASLHFAVASRTVI